MLKRTFSALGLFASVLFSGCDSLMLPDFNGGLLNPDIRFLKAGEVMNGVKCAMTEFMRERQLQIYRERIETYQRRSENPKRFLLLYASEYSPNFADAQRAIAGNRYNPLSHQGSDNEFTPYAMGLDQSLLPLERECNPLPAPGEPGRSPKDLRHWSSKERRCIPNAQSCKPQLGVLIWQYHSRNKFGTPEAGDGKCVAVPDYSRFALDPQQQATVNLQLLANNFGNINYLQINAKGLGALQTIIAPGNNATRAPFPAVQFTDKATTTFEMAVQMPQTLTVPDRLEDSPYKNPTQRGAEAYAKLDDHIKTVSAQGAGQTPRNHSETGDLSPAAVAMAGEAGQAAQPKRIRQAQDASPILVADDVGLPKSTVENARKFLEDKCANAQFLSVDKNRDRCNNRSRLQDYVKENPAERSAIERFAAEPGRLRTLERLPSQDAGKTGAPSVQSAEPYKPLQRARPANPAQATRYPDLFTEREIDFIKHRMDPVTEFETGCGVNGVMQVDQNTEVDYLALKDMLLNVVSQQNEALTYGGSPKLALDTLTLTTAFNVVLDASAGTKHIFRLFPMIVPPTMEFKADHTHQLKIILRGAKDKGLAASGQRLTKQCLERVLPKTESNGVNPGFCETDTGRLIESIAESVEKSGGGGNGSASGGNGGGGQ